MNQTKRFSLRNSALAALMFSIGLTGCGGNSSSSTQDPVITENFGIIATAADDYTSGEVELVAIEETGMQASGDTSAGFLTLPLMAMGSITT